MFKAIHDNVIILPDEAQEEVNGIVLAPNAIEKSCTGIVISAGPGIVNNKGYLEEHNIKEGDHVLFGKSALVFPIEEDGKTYYMMKLQHLWGTV